MFDPERLLGQMMGDALSGRLGGGKRRKPHRGGLGLSIGSGMSTATKAKVGLGLLGLAVAAYQHYQGQQGARSAPAPAGAPPPSPFASATPPPPPGAGMPPPPPIAPPSPARSEHAMLLLRAMITAADADGLIDATEREAILGRARDAGFDDESLQQLDAEIRAPLTVAQLAVRTPAEMRDEVYAAALLTIHADTDAERAFLADLAARLALDPARRAELHAQLEPENPVTP